ncbi:MAG: FAD-dependent oxidoreductase, partial [Microcoleus sp. T3-bin5]|nr:FAD-dependent oxidoreductase [Microcoleus sp. T3-bin5]
MLNEAKNQSPHHVVIVGGGFGGLYAAKALGKAPVKVTLIDKRNFHLFQPLLYQVATGGLSAGDISSPLRSVLSRQKNTEVLMGEVSGIDPSQQTVKLQNKELTYDTLIVATGVSHHYFGNDQWAPKAPGLKTVEDALEMRRRIFLAFEAAEKETDPEKRRAW